MFATKFPIDVVETMFNLTTPLTNPSQYVTFHIQNHVWEHWFDQHEGFWRVFTVTRRSSTQLFDLHERFRVQIFS